MGGAAPTYGHGHQQYYDAPKQTRLETPLNELPGSKAWGGQRAELGDPGSNAHRAELGG